MCISLITRVKNEGGVRGEWKRRRKRRSSSNNLHEARPGAPSPLRPHPLSHDHSSEDLSLNSLQAGPGSDSLTCAVSKEGADTRSPIKALQMGGFHFMLTHGGHQSSTGNRVYRSAPQSPHKVPPLTLSDPSLGTHQGPITTWAKLMIKR